MSSPDSSSLSSFFSSFLASAGAASLLEAVVMFHVQRSRALVSGHLDGDAGGVVDLAVLDDQLPLLALRHDLDSLSVRNNLNTILVPLCRSIVLLNPNLEGGGLPLHHVLALQLAGEGVLEGGDRHLRDW